MALRQWLQQLDNAVVYGVGLGLLTIPVLRLIFSYHEAPFQTLGWAIFGAGSIGMIITGMVAYHLTSPGKAVGKGLSNRPWRPIERIALLSVAVPMIAVIVAAVPFTALLIIGFFFAVQFGVTLLPWSIVTTAAWTFVFVTLTNPRNVHRIEESRGAHALFWLLLMGFAVVLVLAIWIVADRALDDGTRPVDIVIEQSRRDAGRTDRWRLRVPPGFVPRPAPRHHPLSRFYGGGGRRDIDYLNLEIGSAMAPSLMPEHERRDGPRVQERNSWILNVTIGGAFQGDPDQRAIEAFTRLEQGCHKSAMVNGLVEYNASDQQRCIWAGGTGVKLFAAGSAPGRYELVIRCHYSQFSPSAITAGYVFPNRCEIDDLSMRGWRVRLRFNERHLPNWRQVMRQVVNFLDEHTVESTTGLPGSNLGWIKADGR